MYIFLLHCLINKCYKNNAIKISSEHLDYIRCYRHIIFFEYKKIFTMRFALHNFIIGGS